MRSTDRSTDRVGWERLTPTHMAVGYAVLGLTWIVASDVALTWLAGGSVEWMSRQVMKGSAFVLVTAVLLWVLLRQYMNALHDWHERYRRSERTFSTLLSNLPGIAYRCRNDEPYTLLFASEGGRELTGYELMAGDAEARPAGIGSLIEPEDLPAVRRAVAEAIAQDRPFQLTYRIRRKDGAIRWVWEQGRAMSDGEILEGFITDITEQMQAQEALRGSEKRYRMLIETAMEGVVIIDRSSQVLFANPQMASMLGLSVRELTGKRVTELVAPDLVDDVAERLQRRWRGESEQYETRFRGPGGRSVWAIVTTNPIFDDAGEVTGALAMITDISQRVGAEQKLRESEQRYRDLADSRKLLLNELDHRVKNNLAGLHALLSMYARSAKSVDDFAAFMRQKLVAMTTVHEMIAAAKWEPIRLRDLIRYTSSQFRGPEAGDHSIDAEGPQVTVPPRQVGPVIMILHELLTNSRKHGAYSRPGGHIRIRWDAEVEGGDGTRLSLRWTESGGPTIVQASEPGLGLGLVEGFVRHELGGAFSYELPAEGFRCTIEGTLDAISEQPALR